MFFLLLLNNARSLDFNFTGNRLTINGTTPEDDSISKYDIDQNAKNRWFEELYIEGKIKTLESDCFSDMVCIAKVVIISNVTDIKSRSFANCINLTEIHFPLSLRRIYENAFQSCSFETIEFPQELEEIKDLAFEECKSLITVIFDGDNIDISAASFSNCPNLTTIKITSETYYQFYNGAVYKEDYTTLVMYPPAETKLSLHPNVKVFQYYAFASSALEELPIPSTVESIEHHCFINMNKIKQFKIPKSVKNFSSTLFYKCSNLEKLEIECNIKTIDPFFCSSNTNLTEVILPDTVVEIEQFAFTNCKHLSKIRLPSCLKSIKEKAFSDSGLEIIEMNDDLSDIGNQAFKGCSKLTTIKFNSKIKSLRPGVFQSCTGLKSIELPSNVEEIGYGLFQGCSSLEKIIFHGPVKIMNNTFVYCTSLTTVELPNSLTNIGSLAFAYCSKLSEIVIPSSVKVIDGSAFSYCEKLQKVTFKGSIDLICSWAFSYCTSLKHISLPEISEMEWSVFYGTGLVEITIPDNLLTIPDDCFNNCVDLKTVVLGSNTGTISERAFSNCISLETVKFNDNLVVIENYVFTNCTSLKSVKFGHKLSNIYRFIFQDSGIEEIIITSNPELDTYCFSRCPKLKSVDIGNVYRLPFHCFENSSISEIILPPQLTEVREDAFTNCKLKNVTILGSANLRSRSFFNCGEIETLYISKISQIAEDAFSGTTIISKLIYCGNQTLDYNLNNVKSVVVSGFYRKKVFGGVSVTVDKKICGTPPRDPLDRSLTITISVVCAAIAFSVISIIIFCYWSKRRERFSREKLSESLLSQV